MSFLETLAAAWADGREALSEVVTYSPSVGDPVEVFGVYDEAYVKVEAGEPGISSKGPAVFLTLDDLPSDPSDDDATITIRSVEYSIAEAMPDGTGGVLVRLHRT